MDILFMLVFGIIIWLTTGVIGSYLLLTYWYNKFGYITRADLMVVIVSAIFAAPFLLYGALIEIEWGSKRIWSKEE